MNKYLDSGVDIAAADALVEDIKILSSGTSTPGVLSELGGFGASFELFRDGKYDNPVLVSSTDGVGTKLLVAQAVNNHKSIGIDLVAMCVNDILVQGAKPLFFLDYFATGILDGAVALEVLTGIAEGCKEASISLVGGETAEMPGMYSKGHYDLAGFVVGIAEKSDLLPNFECMSTGDILVGVASSGLHSNGFSLVRKILKDLGINYSDTCSFANNATVWADVLLEPTKIYVKSILPLRHLLKGAAHITGGGFVNNIPRILPAHLAAKIYRNRWKIPDIFTWLEHTAKVEWKEMLETFNCGIGMVLIVAPEAVSTVREIAEGTGEITYVIGELVQRQEKAIVLA